MVSKVTGSPPRVSQRGHGVYAPNQRRPQVTLKKPIDAFEDGNGHSGGKARRGKWAVSAVADGKVTLYNPKKDGDIRVVKESDLKRAVKGGADRKELNHALKSRHLTERSSQPNGTTLYANPNDVHANGRVKYVPPGGSSESITGRGGNTLWGVSTPNKKHRSGTGYAGLPMTRGDKFVETGETRGTTWVEKGNSKKKADVTWALGYSQQPDGKWVKQWVVKSIKPRDGEPEIDPLSATQP